MNIFDIYSFFNNILRCLENGLTNPDSNLTKEEENEYNLYNKSREASLALCHKQCELFKYDMRLATTEEVEINNYTKLFISSIEILNFLERSDA